MNISYSACWIVPVPPWQPLTWSQTSFVQEHSNWQSPPYDGKAHGFVQLIPENPFSHAVNEIIKNSVPCLLVRCVIKWVLLLYFSNKYLTIHYCNMLWTVGDLTIFSHSHVVFIKLKSMTLKTLMLIGQVCGFPRSVANCS